MVSKKKKIIIISVMAVLLIATGVLNVVLNNAGTKSTQQVSTTITSANFFSTYRSDRQETRGQEILYLEAIIASDASSSEAKKTAETKRAQLIEQMDKEMVCENLIMARGFSDCIVSSAGSGVNVVVNAQSLTSNETNKISGVVNEIFGISNGLIKIIPYA